MKAKDLTNMTKKTKKTKGMRDVPISGWKSGWIYGEPHKRAVNDLAATVLCVGLFTPCVRHIVSVAPTGLAASESQKAVT